MKRFIGLALLVLPVCGFASRGGDPYVLITPAKPHPGDLIQISYNHASPDAVFRGDAPIIARVLLPITRIDSVSRGVEYDSTGKQSYSIRTVMKSIDSIAEYPMKREGNRSVAFVRIPKESAGYLFVKFATGTTEDLNRGVTWRVMLSKTDGQPMPMAHFHAAYKYQSGDRTFRLQRSLDSAKSCFRMEKRLFPEHIANMGDYWRILWESDSGDATRREIHADLDTVLVYARKSKRVYLGSSIQWFEKLGRSREAAELRKLEAESDSTGRMARMKNEMSAWLETDHGRRQGRILEVLKEGAEDAYMHTQLVSSLVWQYLREGNIDSSLFWLDSLAAPGVSLACEVAGLCYTKPEYRERGFAVVKSAIDAAFDHDSAGRLLLKEAWPSDAEDWPNEEMLLEAYLQGLRLRGRDAELLGFCESSFASLDRASLMVNSHLVEEYYRLKNYEAVLRVVPRCIDADRAVDGMFDRYRFAYERFHGSAVGLDDTLAALRSRMRSRVRARIATRRINVETADRQVTTLEGKELHLSDFKGKVTVVEFWSTWSSPWLRSFPKLAHACSLYGNDTRVAILAVNAYQSISDDPLDTIPSCTRSMTTAQRDSIVRAARSFMRCAPIFAIDTDPVERYHGRSLPRTLVIGKNGRTQFRERITQNTMLAEEELAAEIELLLKSDS